MRPSPRRLIAALAAAAAAVLSGCSIFSSASPTPRPSGVATNPPGSGAATTTVGSGAPAASGSATPQTSGERTVLAQLGLRMHVAPSLSAQVVGTLAWSDTVTVTGFNPAAGGWYHVQGASTTGWIVADPAYTASGGLSSISFQDKQIDGALYPATWTYSDSSGEVLFEPQSGSDVPTLVVRLAANFSALGATGLTGYTAVSSSASAVACGYTGNLVQYTQAAAAGPQPTTDPGGGNVTRLSDFVQFRATLSPSVAIDIEMNYASTDQYTVFQDFLDSIRYPFPRCEAGTGGPSPSPT